MTGEHNERIPRPSQSMSLSVDENRKSKLNRQHALVTTAPPFATAFTTALQLHRSFSGGTAHRTAKRCAEGQCSVPCKSLTAVLAMLQANCVLLEEAAQQARERSQALSMETCPRTVVPSAQVMHAVLSRHCRPPG